MPTPTTSSTSSALTRWPRLLGLLGLLGAGLLVVGCGILPFGGTPSLPSPSVTLLPEGTTEVTVAVGQSVQVSLGTGSPGVGDDWGVVSGDDTGVAQADVVQGKAVEGVADDGSAPPGSSMPCATGVIHVLGCRSPNPPLRA